MRKLIALAFQFVMQALTCMNSGMDPLYPELQAGGDNAAAIARQHPVDSNPRTVAFESTFGPPRTPGQYATAANLGMAYELSGDNILALKSIKEAVRGDTEWPRGMCSPRFQDSLHSTEFQRRQANRLEAP